MTDPTRMADDWGPRTTTHATEVPVHRRLTSLLAALALVAALSSAWAPAAAAAGPVEGPVFNDPTGTDVQQMAIMTKIMNAISGTRRGATIRIAVFSFTIEEFADRLINAYKRGVHVRLIVDDHETWPAFTRVQQVLGKNVGKSSFAVHCRGACLTENQPSYMHTKLFQFSLTDGVPWVSMVASANPTYFQARRGWNNGYMIVNDTVIYEAVKLAFETMAKAAANPNQPTTSPNAYFTATSGKYKFYNFPKGGLGRDNDTMWGIFQNIRCTGVATGYGSSGYTTIRLAMYQWSVLRIRLAERIWDLDDQGCKVTIMFDPTRVDSQVLATLTKRGGRHGGPTIVPAATDDDDNGVVDQMIHDKYWLINGVYAGDTSAKVVFTGSANWTNNSLHYNDEYLLRIWDNAVFKKYSDHWDKVRAFAKDSIPFGKPIVPIGGTRPPIRSGASLEYIAGFD
jgi:phosphatidylserine/phosphatidylglycerophosphate/cardiolipin synthase-like enzyme